MQSEPSQRSSERDQDQRQHQTVHRSVTYGERQSYSRRTYKIGNNDVLWCKPSNNAEITQSWHKEARQEVPSECAQPDIEKKLPP